MGVISHESPEPGYIAASLIALSQSRLRHQQHLLRYCPLFAIPMASAVTYRRQLAPTVGLTEALSGVLIWTRPFSSPGARVATGLILRVGALDLLVDNASRFGAGVLPPGGVILSIGSHCVFVASVADTYPQEVRVFSSTTDPLPPSCCSTAPDGSAPHICVGVMMAGATSSRHSSGGTTARAARETAAATTVGPSEKRDVLNTPVERNADLAVAHAELEEARKQLAERAKSIDAEGHGSRIQRRACSCTAGCRARRSGRASRFWPSYWSRARGD